MGMSFSVKPFVKESPHFPQGCYRPLSPFPPPLSFVDHFFFVLSQKFTSSFFFQFLLTVPLGSPFPLPPRFFVFTLFFDFRFVGSEGVPQFSASSVFFFLRLTAALAFLVASPFSLFRQIRWTLALFPLVFGTGSPEKRFRTTRAGPLYESACSSLPPFVSW